MKHTMSVIPVEVLLKLGNSDFPNLLNVAETIVLKVRCIVYGNMYEARE